MTPIGIVTVVGAAAVAFYVRFLVALCTECKPRLIGYWVRVRLNSRNTTIAEMEKREDPGIRAA